MKTKPIQSIPLSSGKNDGPTSIKKLNSLVRKYGVRLVIKGFPANPRILARKV